MTQSKQEVLTCVCVLCVQISLLCLCMWLLFRVRTEVWSEMCVEVEAQL